MRSLLNRKVLFADYQFVIILLLAAWLFWHNPLQVPPGLEMDELIEAQIAERIQAGDWQLFYSAGQGREPLYHFWLAFLLSLVGRQLFTLRLASTMISLISLATVYRFVRSLFGRTVATLSAVTGVTSFWFLFAARSGLRSTSLPLVASLAGIMVWKGIHAEDKGRSMALLAGGGALTGLAFYTYTASRVLPLVFLGFFVYLVLFQRPVLRGRLPGFLTGALLALLLLLPLLLFLRANPGADEFAFMDFNRPLVALQQGDPLPAVDTARQTLGMFSFSGDPLIFDNIPDRPVFGAAVGILFYLGLAMSLWRWRDPAAALSIIWLGVSLLPGMFSQPAPNFYRTVLAQVVTPIFPAIAIVSLSTWSGRLFKNKSRVAYRLTIILGIILIAWQLAQSWRSYFQEWPHVEGIHFFWQESLAETARYLDEAPEIQRAAICTSLVDERDAWWRPAWQSLPYLSLRDDLVVGFYDCRQSLILPDEPTVYIFPDDQPPSVLPEAMRWITIDAEQLISPLPKTSGEVFFQPGSFESENNPSQTACWAPEAGGGQTGLPVNFGSYLALEAYEYVQAGLTAGGQVSLLTSWRLLAPPEIPLTLFTHIMSDAQSIVTQQDSLPVSLRSLRPGDRFWVLHDQLWLPADSSAGDYLVAIGVYNPETLLRQPVGKDDGGKGDRLFLARCPVD